LIEFAARLVVAPQPRQRDAVVITDLRHLRSPRTARSRWSAGGDVVTLIDQGNAELHVSRTWRGASSSARRSATAAATRSRAVRFDHAEARVPLGYCQADPDGLPD
jgi:hypothetical protein